ncbi:uncharacterized protein BDV14DRAFT_200675 [Aspergillus stella-maris]|uniref:uncharacterized protein n=1 Tax=Aspergillus stella-maris TaxID=1810926 RepID=UPI003CCD103B
MVNLLITLAANGHDGDFLPASKEKGISPDTEASIMLFNGNYFQAFTTSTYLAVLGTQTGREMPGVEWDSYFWCLLENFLHFGADPNVLFLILCGRHISETPTIRRTRTRSRERMPDETMNGDEVNERQIRYLHLRELMEMVQPPNIKSLQQYFDRPLAPAGAGGSWWNVATRMISGFSSAQGQHQLQHDYIAEAEQRYPKYDKNEEAASEMRDIVEVRTRTHYLPRNAIIQLY